MFRFYHFLSPQFFSCATVIITATFAGCSHYSPQALPTTEIPVAFQTTLDHSAIAPNTPWQKAPIAQWWQAFGSLELNQLFDELEQQNFDLKTASITLAQAKSVYAQQRSQNWPTLDAGINNRNGLNFDNGTHSQSDGLNFSAGYEIDLWGQRNAENNSAAMALLAQQQSYRSTLLQLRAQLTQSYFNTLALRDRVTIAQQNLTASADLFNLIKIRFEAGSASRIELDQQRNVLLNSQAQLHALQRNNITSERTLAVLLGRTSIATANINGAFSQLQTPDIAPLQPAALLEARPDIAIAEAYLREQEANVFAQRKKRWPRLTLSADINLSDLADLSQGWSGSLVEGLTMPIFNAGKIKQQIAYAEGSLEKAQLSYQYTVLQAFSDTLETLSEWQYQNTLHPIREQELSNNQRLYSLARLRYDAGDTDFLTLLAAQRSWFNARDSHIQAQNQRLQAAVNVYRAMGNDPALNKTTPLTDK